MGCADMLLQLALRWDERLNLEQTMNNTRQKGSRHGMRASNLGNYQEGDDVPGRQNMDGSPDMRDKTNRIAFGLDDDDSNEETESRSGGNQRRNQGSNQSQRRNQGRNNEQEEDDEQFDIQAEDYEEMSDEELTQTAVIVMEEIQHRFGHRFAQSRSRRSGGGDKQNQDGSPDRRFKQNGGGRQGQGRVRDPQNDDRVGSRR